MTRRFPFSLGRLLGAVGYERSQRKVWIVTFAATILSISCCGLLGFAVRWFSEPGWDHYANIEQLKADFDCVHVIPAPDLFTKLRGGLAPLFKSRSVFAATRGQERASLYLQDVSGEFWKVTPERLFAPLPPLATTTQWRYWYRDGVLSGRWDFTTARVTPPGAQSVIVYDEFSVMLDDRNRMK